MQRYLLILLLPFCFMIAHAQEVRLPRTVKIYPLDGTRLYVSAGYEHGLLPRLSLTGFASRGFMGIWVPTDAIGGAGSGCNRLWSAQIVSFRAGPRFYPAKGTRHSPFYIDLLFAYRRMSFQDFSKHLDGSCEGGTMKAIRPLKSRIGMMAMAGGALRRDMHFTMDIFGGIGIHSEREDERQITIPPNSDPFYQPTPVETFIRPTLHLGLSIGWNFHGMRRG